MKITPQDYEYLRARLEPLDTPERRAEHYAMYKNPGKNADMAYRWYLLLRVAKIKIGDGAGARGDIELYSYLDDNHIDTALRKIVKPLK